MPFVKIDTNILNSTLWFDRICRELFLTSLFMAEPVELTEPKEQLEIRSLESTGWNVPAGWYGFVNAAGVGIIHRAMIDDEEIGLQALERLGSPEEGSRTSEFEGRRLVRVDGGFVVLNYMKYRERDYTSAERSRRYREKKKQHTVTLHNHTVASRSITQAEAERIRQKEKAEAENGEKIP